MAEYFVENVQMAISNAVESPYNATIIDDDETVYQKFQVEGGNFYLFDKEKFDNSTKVGTGKEFATEQHSGYIKNPRIDITDTVNIDIMTKFLKRFLGGADVVSAEVEVDTDVYNHALALRATSASRQFPSSTILWNLGGADCLWAGAVFDTFEVSQNRAEEPKFSTTIVSSGKYTRLRDIPSMERPDPNLIPFVNPRYAMGANSRASYTDDTGLVRLANFDCDDSMNDAQRMLSFRFTMNNNSNLTDRRMGDPMLDCDDPSQGNYVNRIQRGRRSFAGEFTVVLDDTIKEVLSAYNDVAITNFTWVATGKLLNDVMGAATDLVSEVEFKIPKCYFRDVSTEEDNGLGVVRVGIFPVDNLTDDLVQVRVRTNTNVAFV